jgi:hypothetical protein
MSIDWTSLNQERHVRSCWIIQQLPKISAQTVTDTTTTTTTTTRKELRTTLPILTKQCHRTSSNIIVGTASENKSVIETSRYLERCLMNQRVNTTG